VLCHMALMLMDRPEDVLLEIRRVLRPGGRFGAVTNRPTTPDAVAKTILGALRPAFERARPSLHPPRLGDVRTYQAGTLLALLAAHFEDVVVEEFAVVEHIPRRVLWPYLVDSVYGIDAIDAEEARTILDGLTLPDPMPWTTPMLQVQARA
jgi:SAM-dependent methyltransferase